MTTEAWTRFQTYATRVRYLHMNHWDWINPLTWAFLSRWCGPRPLLPNLQELSILPLDVVHPTTMIFISPSLRHLALELHYSTAVISGEHYLAVDILLRTITSTAPCITDLSIRNPHSRVPLPVQFGYTVARLTHLQSLKLENMSLDLKVLQWFARVDKLHTLFASIELGDVEEYAESGDDLFEAPEFSQLRHLSLRGTCRDLCTFIANLSPPPLLSVALDASEPCSTGSISDIWYGLVDAFGWDNDPAVVPIENFALRYPHSLPEQDNVSLVAIINSLFLFRTLKTVKFEFEELPALTDDALSRMIEAWPELTELHIPAGTTQRFPHRIPARPTMSSLVAFARRCPKLVKLTLPEIDLDTTLPCRSNMPFVKHPLHSLCVSFYGGRRDTYRDDGPSWRHFDAARMIDRLFPSVILQDPPARKTEYRIFAEKEENVPARVREYLEAMHIGRRNGRLLKGRLTASGALHVG